MKVWLNPFLIQTYLRNYEELSRKRPRVEDAEIWIGQTNASYGILGTPRFKNGKWENDKSKICHFKSKRWTIGRILETGVVLPDEDDRNAFIDADKHV